MATIKVDATNFQSEVIEADGPVVVDFWAQWCGPCKAIAASLEEISEEMAGQVKIVKLDIDDSPDIATRYGVRSIPTLALFKDGEVIGARTGASPKSALSQWIGGAV